MSKAKDILASVKHFFVGGKTFCCCLPTRIGVIIMSSMSILFAGILSVIIWFEVASTPTLTSGESTAFVAAGIVSTLLFVVSILGFAGAIARKQLFVMAYAYFIYAHFILNVGIASYLLWMISHAENRDIAKTCQDAIQDPQAKQQCTSIFQVTKGVFIGVALTLLLIELYGTLIVARYVNQLRTEKQNVRVSRMMRARASRMMGSEGGAYLIPKDSTSDIDLWEYDPSHPSSHEDSDSRHLRASVTKGFLNSHTSPDHSYSGLPGQQFDEESGYGGGQWTYDEIPAEEEEMKTSIQPGIEEVHQGNGVEKEESRQEDGNNTV